MQSHHSLYATKLLALERKIKNKDLSRNARLRLLASMLGSKLNPPRSWSDKALYRVLAGHAPGRFLAKAIDLASPSSSVRDRSKDAPRLYVSFGTREIVAFVEKYLSADERRELLLSAAKARAAK